MKKLSIFLFIFGLFVATPAVYAQGMMGQPYFNVYTNPQTNEETVNDEAQGKAIWDKMQSKLVDCKSLSDDDYDVLGDYFMGLMAGSSHAAMNLTMTQMMGDQGEKQMHIVMGKRFSGCDTAAALPAQYQGFSFMMPMMGGYGYQSFPMFANGYNFMMGQNGFSFVPVVCWISLILFWTVLVFVIFALWHYIKGSKRK